MSLPPLLAEPPEAPVRKVLCDASNNSARKEEAFHEQTESFPFPPAARV